MASKKPTQPAAKPVGKKGPTIPKPSRKQIEAVLEDIREQCFGEDEEAAVWTEKLTEELDLPFKALLMPDSGRRNAPPRPVEVLNVSEGEEGPIAEVRLGDGTEVPVRLKDLIPVDAAEDTILLLHAYREWIKGRDDYDDDEGDEDDDYDDDDYEDDEDDEDWEDEEDEDLVLNTAADVPDVLDDDLDEFPEIDDAIEGESEEEDEEEEEGERADDEDDDAAVASEDEDDFDEDDDDDRPRKSAKKPSGKKPAAKEEKGAKKPALKEEKGAKKPAVKEEKPAAKKPALKEEKLVKVLPKEEPKKPTLVVKEEKGAKKPAVKEEKVAPVAKKPAATKKK